MDPILLVEDRDSLRLMLRRALEGQGHTVAEARDQVEAEAELKRISPGLVLSDLKLPRGDGLGVLRAAKSLDPDVPVIVMTAYGSIQDAVGAMKEGALDFLAKPVDPDHLLLLVERALAGRRLAGENAMLREELASRRGGREILSEAPALRQAVRSLERAAGTDTTVLLLGESGTGKELFARALHAHSARSAGPFVAVNCAAIPEALLESELFGYERGAFTGALSRKPGRFELAHRGTLFLDEVGDLPLALQGKVLRALEERRFERLGGTATIQVNVRVVAATNQDLRGRVAARLFRDDLFFRLSVFPITIPPLRERAGDIPLLAGHFVRQFCRELSKPALTLSPASLEVLQQYAWPGNVRELQNCMERAVILADGRTIDPVHLNLPVAAAGTPVGCLVTLDLTGTLEEATKRARAEVERRKIASALLDAAGEYSRAAALLGITAGTLQAKMREHDLA